MAQKRESAAKDTDIRVPGNDDDGASSRGRGLYEVAFVTHRGQTRTER
jgi:hypothetical protein